MRSIRTIAYAAFLMLSAFALQPTLVAAEDARGNFTLPHEVHLQDQVLPAGNYSFSVKPTGPAELLLLRGVDKTSFGALVMVTSVGTPKTGGFNRLVLVSKNGQSYISAIELPEFDVILRFKVPSEDGEGRITADAALGTRLAQ
jgi:hypothetical protein